MSGFWEILELEPTRDISAIRRAYAQKTLVCHPEENPEGFLKLRKAYREAMDYAEGETGDFVGSIADSGAGGAGHAGADAGKADTAGSGGAGTDAEGTDRAGTGAEGPDRTGTDAEGADATEQDVGEPYASEAEDEGWALAENPKYGADPNPYTDHEAIRSFLDLYTGRQRKDQKRWLDYFTSNAFLDVAWDGRFTALLLEHVTRLETEYPVNREFLIWLCVAYQFTVHKSVYRNPDGSERVEFQFQTRMGAQFDGLQSVFEIVTKGPAPKYPKGNELAVTESFSEYRRLLSMAERDVWSEQEIGEYSEIIGCYAAIYITDKCQQRGDMDHERHPAGLRLMTHFFRREGLPEELYRITWQRLNLETAIMGREKIFYGVLRELILERLPELAGQQREKFTELREAFHTYAVSTCKLHGENAGATEEDIRRTEDFFARADFQRALLDRRFVEEEMLHTWVNEDRCDLYLRKVIQFYMEHESAPCAGRVIDRAREMLKYQEHADRQRRDREAEVSEDPLSLKSSPFFRHWLNTGFYQARDPESGRGLLEYLNRELPYLPEWSRGFLGVTGKEITPRQAVFALGGDTVEARFHLRYMEFLLNGEPVYRPCLTWEKVAGLGEGDSFFLCLPVTVTTYDQYEPVKREILRRLEHTAAPEDGRQWIAACLAGQICSLPVPGEAGQGWDWAEDEPPEICSLPPESVLPFELFAEDAEHLYGCEWIERSQTLLLFEQLPIGRQRLRDGWREDVADAREAITLARQMLEETIAPPRLPMELLVNLPDAVYAMPDLHAISREQDAMAFWSRPVELLGKADSEAEMGTDGTASGAERKASESAGGAGAEPDGTASGAERKTSESAGRAEQKTGGIPGKAVTREKLEELLTQFANDRLTRLELSWNIAPPVGEEQDYEARRSLVFMKGSLGYVCLYFDDFRAKSFALLERPDLYGRTDGRLKFVPFRQGKLFNLVIHRSFSSIRRRLDVIFRQVSWPGNVDYMAGGIWDYAINVSNGRSKYNLDKQLLADFPMERAHNRPDAPFYFLMYPESAARVDERGSVEKLEVDQARRGRLQQMMIGFLEGGFCKMRLTFGGEAGRRKHIVLLQERGRFLMAWLEEEKRTVQYHVADTGIYMDVEGRKYPKDTFQGRTVPAYLVHDGVTPLRNALELLLANLDDPARITGRFAEYAGEKPVKPRPYEELWEELAGD